MLGRESDTAGPWQQVLSHVGHQLFVLPYFSLLLCVLINSTASVRTGQVSVVGFPQNNADHFIWAVIQTIFPFQ